MSVVTKPFLLLCGITFIVIGFNTFRDPVAAMALVELNISSVSALNEMRANYGGMQIGIGLLLLAGFRQPSLAAPALLAQSLIVGGLVMGRLISILMDGAPNAFILGLLALEAFTVVVSLLLFLQQRRAT